MERFRVRVAGGDPLEGSPAFIRNAYKDTETAGELTSLDEHLRLAGRVYSLEKEIQIVSNILLLGIMVAGYFAYRWYLDNVGSIPGVAT